ncbi:MAG: 1-acyl-sn-glycerol-3-phosphate acyltransferase [Planctomycetaceae bacterium]
MQKLVFDEPYQFVPPYRGTFWSWVVGRMLPRLLRSRYGLTSWKSEGLEHLRESLKAGHGVILCPNHCRASDPMATGIIVTETPVHAYAMASWHVFRQSWLEAFVCRRIGAFSVYREGMDRKALDLAIEIVSSAERPLIVFAEGVISAANDRLLSLMDGASFIAHTAARRRAKENPGAQVVVHPVSFVYEHRSDPTVSLGPVLTSLEERLFWQTFPDDDIRSRIDRLREALQCAREVQVFGQARTGDTEQRIGAMVNHVLQQHETAWLGKPRTGDVVARVKDLRIALLADMVAGKVDNAERARRWRVLRDLYYAQCISMHVPGYLDRDAAGHRYNHRLFETVERMEEEVTDVITTHNDLHVTVKIGEAIAVPPEKKPRGDDPLMNSLRREMLKLLGVPDLWPPQPVQWAGPVSESN